ncbi:Gfo/Idh/MocA family protein [Desulfatiglans anilini]|uniref:Gfo/Idh/MocA family protein n=1 Tax=Desulfatiglans anilini TaxID=90728 RepID=UPI000551C957|nr:Gfo/Idh/MocA family oxidoreductase [Desulfatiglans anilini]
MHERVRVGVIGVGHLGEYHVQKYTALPEAELVGVVDSDAGRAEEISRRYGTMCYDDLDGLLGRVDAVSLAVPTEQHHEVGRRILKAGVHVLIEKPITYDLAHAGELIALADKAGLVLQVGHVERFNPAVVEMSGMLDRPIFIESHRMNLFTTRGTDVDVVLDLMIHDLDIILHMVRAEVREVHAVGLSVITPQTDIANVRIIFDNGTVGNLTASRVSNNMLRKIRIFQPDAYISVNCAKREISRTELDREQKGADGFPQIVTRKKSFPGSDPLADQIAAFVKAVREGAAPVVSGRDGRRALQVALAIIDQIKEGCDHFKRIR